MSSTDLDFDFDSQMSTLEMEWRQVYTASIMARAKYQMLAAQPKVKAKTLDIAREAMERAEASKERIMHRIERLEIRLARRY